MQAGGSVEDTAYRWPLLPDDKHWSTYGRLSYDLTDNVTAIVEAGYAGSDTHNWSAAYNRQGASAIIVSRENPYLPQIGRATSALQSLMRISYAVFCLKKKKTTLTINTS